MVNTISGSSRCVPVNLGRPFGGRVLTGRLQPRTGHRGHLPVGDGRTAPPDRHRAPPARARLLLVMLEHRGRGPPSLQLLLLPMPPLLLLLVFAAGSGGGGGIHGTSARDASCDHWHGVCRAVVVAAAEEATLSTAATTS